MWMRARLLAYDYSRWRTRVGRPGTALGLLVVTALATALYILLRLDFAHPLAPWVWLAMLVVLVLTFVGVHPMPPAGTLIPHDPSEPRTEPPVSRAEWLLVVLIMAGAVLVRVWDLEHIPAGPYIDEADRIIDARHLNAGEPVNREQFFFFGTGWWGVPSLYFWLVAQSLKVFGDTLAGARMMHVIAGVLAVWFTYRTGRVAWSPRVGVLAGALMAVSDFAIQFSRTAGESTLTLLTWVACFYFLYKALKHRRPLDFVLSGLAGGFTLYTYGSGKLLPLVMLGVAVYLLVRWGLKGARLYLPGLVLLALTAGLTYAPNGLFVLTRKPQAFTERSYGISIFSQHNLNRLVQDHGTDNWAIILPSQFMRTYSAFDVGQERGPFYPKGEPMLPVPWAALWVLGTAYMVWRVGDARYGLLALWLLGGLAGAALTTDTPTMQRVVGMVPLLGLLPALFLDRIASGLRALVAGSGAGARQAGRYAAVASTGANLALAGLVLLLAYQCLTFYFGPYASKALYIEFTLAGRYVEKLSPHRDMVYQFNLPVMFGDPNPFYFFVRDVPVRDFANAPDELPVTGNQGRDVHFLVSPPDDPILKVLQSYYPGGELRILSKPDGTAVVAAYHVTAAQLDSQRYVTARYGPPSGPLFEVKEPRIGTTSLSPGDYGRPITPPAWITYPTTAEWTGGLVAPVYGTYYFSLDAPAGATLSIDGRVVLTTTVVASSAQTRLVLAKGVHTVRLGGTLDGVDNRIELRWGADPAELAPVARHYLWGGHRGALLGESHANVGVDPRWLTQPQIEEISNGRGQPMTARRDGFMAWRQLNFSLHGGPNVFGIWKGALSAPLTGTYTFDANTTGLVSIWLDGQPVGGRGVDGVPALPISVPLQRGTHDIEVRFQAVGDNSVLELFWQPPGGARELLPPSALASIPTTAGVWFEHERSGVPVPDSMLFSWFVKQKVRVVRTISGQGTWKEARGVAVLPDGRVVVGDTGNHRLLVYSADGRQQAHFGGPDVFRLLSDVAVAPDGTIAALDADSGDIRLLDASGRPIAHLTHEQVGLSHAQGIAWGPDDKLYVADTAGSRVVRVSREGVQEASLREAEGGLRPLEQPVDVALLPDGTPFAVDLHRRVVSINDQGLIDSQWSIEIGINRGGSHMTVWRNRLVLTNPDDGNIRILDPSSGLVYLVQAEDGKSLDFKVPTGIATGPGDLLYVMDSDNNRIVVLEVVP
jgi:4-amino-4-deoxy-L-arabinose transferase-like glycosyltransferase/sugar lactone lactonase YvrE